MEPFGSRKKGAGQKKGLRHLLGFILIAMVCAVAVAFWAALQHKNHVSPPRENLPKNVARRLSGYTFTRSEQGKQLFTIQAARTLAYSRGSGTVLEDVHVVIFGRAGDRHDAIQTQRCRYDDETGALACSGEASIVLESSTQIAQASNPSAKPPVLLHTSDVSYDPHNSTVTTNRPVRFQYGLISGAAVGLAYNTQKGQLDLRNSVAAELPLREQGQSVARITAGGLLYSKQRSQIILRSPVNVSDGGGQLEASAGVIYLNAEGRATKAVLTGDVRGYFPLTAGAFNGTAAKLTAMVNPATSQIQTLVAFGSVNLDVRQGASGGNRRLSAQTVQISFGGEKGKAQAGFASGRVKMAYVPGVESGNHSPTKVAGPLDGPQTRVLTASKVNFTFQAGGNLKEAHTVGPGLIVSLPAGTAADRQAITAGQFRAFFDSMGRMVRLLGLAKTRILDQPGSDAPSGRVPRETTSQSLEATFDPSTGLAERVTQTGNFQFRQGSVRASADASDYQPGTQEMTLSGRPVVWDPDGRIRARHMELNPGSGIAKAWGKVETVEFQVPGQTAPANPKPSRGQPAWPLIVLSDRVLDNRNTQFMRFEGNVRAWDGPDVVESSSLDVYETAKRVSSGFGVVTSLLSPPSSTGADDAKGKKPRASQARADQPIIIHADHLVYFDIGGRAVYRGHVKVTSANATLRSDSLDVYLSEPAGGGQPVLSRAVAVGSVTVTQPGRRATGQRAEYFAAAGKIVLTGGPPAIYDEQQGFVTAQRLTFFVHDASLFADGGSKAPALSKRPMQQQ